MCSFLVLPFTVPSLWWLLRGLLRSVAAFWLVGACGFCGGLFVGVCLWVVWWLLGVCGLFGLVLLSGKARRKGLRSVVLPALLASFMSET
jgi:hypothetical protein